MVNLKNKTVLVYDYGNFIEVAERLAKDYGKVLYYAPWETSFPKYNQYMVGRGIPNVQRIYNIWDYFEDVDLFYFCDLFQGAFQDWLRSKGKLVFGAGKGEDMELYRDKMKAHQKELELPINEYVVLYGLDALREYLKVNDNKFIKTNFMRGHFESFKHEKYDLTKPLLDELEHTLGIYKNEELFVVEDPIEAIAEVGYDGFVIDGKYPEKTLAGIEVKDCGYVGVIIDYNKLPKQVLEVNKKLSNTFLNYGYRGTYSSEIRIGIDKKGYLIDQTNRQPQPPTSLAIEHYSNYSDIVWDVANGIVPIIKYKYKYGVQVIIKSDWARSEPQAIYFPPQYKDFIKIKNLCIQDGVSYYIPQNIEMEEIGSVIGMSDTLNGAIEQAKTISGEVKGYCVKVDCDSLDKAKEEIEKLNKVGIKLF